MSFKRCFRCESQKPLRDLTYCCSQDQPLCSLCKSRYFCTTCQRKYPIAHRTSQSNGRCPQCKLMVEHCICKVKPHQQTNKAYIYCVECQHLFHFDFIFTNPECNHYYCSHCLTNKRDRCFCLATLNPEAVQMYLRPCCCCDRPLMNSKNYSEVEDMVICKQCSRDNEERQKLFQAMPKRKQNKENKEQKREGFNHQTLVLPPQDRQDQQRRKEIVNQGLSKNIIFEEKEVQQQIPEEIQVINEQEKELERKEWNIEKEHSVPKPVAEKKFEKMSSPSLQSSHPPPKQDLSHQSICSFCNISYESCALFKNSQCSKSHMICKVCIVINKRKRVLACKQCDIESEEALAKRLKYDELKGTEREQYIKRLEGELGACQKCGILIPKLNLFGDQKFCLICVSK